MEPHVLISRCVLICGSGLSVGVLGVISEAFLHYSRRVCASVVCVFTILMQNVLKTCHLGKGTSVPSAPQLSSFSIFSLPVLTNTLYGLFFLSVSLSLEHLNWCMVLSLLG